VDDGEPAAKAASSAPLPLVGSGAVPAAEAAGMGDSIIARTGVSPVEGPRAAAIPWPGPAPPPKEGARATTYWLPLDAAAAAAVAAALAILAFSAVTRRVSDAMAARPCGSVLKCSRV